MPKRKDRVELGLETAQRSAKLGAFGEVLAFADLSAYRFTNFKILNGQKKNHPFADLYAERDGEKFWISVKTRNKYQFNGTLNDRYKVTFKQKQQAKLLVEADPGTEIACVAISVVVTQNSCRDGEKPNSYSCYFVRSSEFAEVSGIDMRKSALRRYECFAENKQIASYYDVKDCENVYARRQLASAIQK
jgi:hypothetical protein